MPDVSILRSKFRKVMTGNEKKRLRDFVQEQPDYVKLGDKIAFTVGLLNILACEFFLVQLPTYFWIWYSLVIPSLILTRVFHFKSLGWQYFLLDFCYFVLLCVFINLYFFPDSQLLFKICFIYTNGPLTMAIVIWRCSLVFHDYDKITSVYVHFLPSLLYYAGKWHGHDAMLLFQTDFITTTLTGSVTGTLQQNCLNREQRIPHHDDMLLKDFGIAALGYLFWQLTYFFKTEILDKSFLDSRPDLLTSLRWMSSDKKNSFAISILNICRFFGLFRRNEEFDASSMKTKLVFISSQFIYTVFTFLPTLLLYNSQLCHIAYLLLIFTMFTFNGASFYVEVFSKAYQQKIEKLREMRKLSSAIENSDGIKVE
mmetsp:Transcript_28109/g.26965  ORF Transcript_28109/g.26965 Transcript_28109/m.26965 type:complete len:369 (+) Transcript_28109:227-1333(+)